MTGTVVAVDIVQTLERLASRYSANPVSYMRQFLGLEPTPQQEQILRLMSVYPYRVLVRSGNNTGKTLLQAVVASHHFDSYANAVGLITGPTQSGVIDGTFRYMRRIRPYSRYFLPSAPLLQRGDESFIRGLVTRDPDAFQGRHSEHMLIIIDEATGVDKEFISRAKTMALPQKGHFLLASYNPNDQTSAVAQLEDEGDWHVVVLSCLDHPNIAAELAGKDPPIPDAIRLCSVLERIASECQEVSGDDDRYFAFDGKLYLPLTPEFEAQILGRWPSQALMAVWSKDDATKLFETRVTIDKRWPVQIGIDVARRFGDDAPVLASRQGTALTGLETLYGMSTKDICEHAKKSCHKLSESQLINGQPINPKRIPVVVDDTGGYGSGVVDYSDGYNFIGINSAEVATDESRYPNKRTELWFKPRVYFDSGQLDFTRCPKSLQAELRKQLLSTRYSLEPGTLRRRVEGKEKTRSRIGRSPDHADAVNLAFYPAKLL